MTSQPKLVEGTVWSTQRRPRFEGCNVGTWIGFKHVNYLVEEGVVQLFRECGLTPTRLLEENALGIEFVDCRLRLTQGIRVDDLVRIEVRPVSKPADTELTLSVTLFRQDEGGAETKLASGKSKVVFRRTGADLGESKPPPAEIARYVVDKVQRAAPRASNPPELEVVGHADLDQEIISKLVPGDTNAHLWRWRVPYFYCHYTERMRHSGYVRLMEEAVDRFLFDRNISIGTLLRERKWIPVVTASQVELLDEAFIDDNLYIVYTMEEIMKDITYTSRMDCYVRRDDRLVRTATGTISHAYIAFTDRAVGSTVVPFDERVLAALNNQPWRGR